MPRPRTPVAAARCCCTHLCCSIPALQASITLVCRRWQQVFYSEPALWRSLELTAESLYDAHADGAAGQWFAAKALLLRRVGGLVRQLNYSQEPIPEEDDEYTPVEQVAAASNTDWRLSSSVLAHLSPASLQSLRLDWVPVDAVTAAQLPRFSSLTQLQLERCGDLPSCVLEALPSLQRLLCLSLWCNIPAGLSTALQHLTQLTSLNCSSRSALPELSAVWPLTRLRQLDWHEAGQSNILEVDLHQLLANLPQLQRWDIFVCRYGQPSMQVCCLLVAVLGWPPERAWDGNVHGFKLAGGQEPCACASDRRAVGLLLKTEGSVCPTCNMCELLPVAVPPFSSQLGGAVLSGSVVRGYNRAKGTVQQLQLYTIRSVPILQQLVAAALPAGTQPSQLRSLSFSHCRLTLPAVLSCPFVGRLASLSLSYCSAQDGNAAPVYEALLQQAPRLLSLSLQCCFWHALIPAAITSCTGLTHLSLAGNGLTELPPGPYLNSECATAAPMQLRFVFTACHNLRSLHAPSGPSVEHGLDPNCFARQPPCIPLVDFHPSPITARMQTCSRWT